MQKKEGAGGLQHHSGRIHIAVDHLDIAFPRAYAQEHRRVCLLLQELLGYDGNGLGISREIGADIHPQTVRTLLHDRESNRRARDFGHLGTVGFRGKIAQRTHLDTGFRADKFHQQRKRIALSGREHLALRAIAVKQPRAIEHGRTQLVFRESHHPLRHGPFRQQQQSRQARYEPPFLHSNSVIRRRYKFMSNNQCPEGTKKLAGWPRA